MFKGRAHILIKLLPITLLLRTINEKSILRNRDVAIM